MEGSGRGIIAVTGATGLQGGAVTRALVGDGWTVRALTRDPGSKRAGSLRALGVELVKVDMNDPDTLEPAFEGSHGVFNVQNWHISGYEGEVTQGENVTDVALRMGVRHVVYGAAGLGTQNSGVGSWDTKVQVVEYMRERGLPVTILRPQAFMELMTASKFFPPASTWYVMPRLMGGGRPVVWLAAEDFGSIVARVFADAARFLGADLTLAADVQSIDECRRIWREVMGRDPRRFPVPLWLFERFVGTDETTMWRWLRANEIPLDTAPTRELLPGALTVRDWLTRVRTAQTASPEPA